MKYRQFIFEDYTFDPASKQLELTYSFDHQADATFCETYRFDFDFVQYDPAALDRAVQSLFFMAGVSYYKAFLASEIVVSKGQLDQTACDFFAKTYQKGLGEFFYVNQLDPNTQVTFPKNSDSVAVTPTSQELEGLLVGIGGGKDSLVSVELLRKAGAEVTTWSLNHRSQLTPLIERIGLPHYWVEREWDPKLLALKEDNDAYNGHVPISAIFACVGTIVAILAGKRDVVVSNEQSANEPTLQYKGVAINHQYSKSQEFETDFQAYLQHLFGDTVRYYSFLRPFSEVRIAELFARLGWEQYHDVFSSCNRAYVHSSNHMSWCGTCPKCAFVFMALTPFVPQDQLKALWGGKNLLLDPALEPTYRQLLGIEGDKPLECVGEIKENRTAMHLAQAQYPELSKYTFELPDSYDYKTLAPHAMPAEIADRLNQAPAATQ